MKRALLPLLCLAAACAPASAPEGLMATPFGSGATVKFDVYHKPLPEIPLPNDFATRFDPGSPTKLRVNASMVAATEWEKGARAVIDDLDGWGTFAPVTVGFEQPLDVMNIIKRHQGDDYDFRDDAVFVVAISPDSPDYCQPVPLDMGEGNFPLVLENQNFGIPTDTRFRNQQLLFDETNEDTNRNGVLDLGEDTDMDGVLDRGNYARDTDGVFQVMSFYERETNTLIMKPVVPLRENTVYAAVVTRRLTDDLGKPVRSPFAYINHAGQTKQLEPLKECLPNLGLALEDVSFTWAFTTQSTTRDYVAVRDGLYGHGPMSRLKDTYKDEVSDLFTLRRCKVPTDSEGRCPNGQQLDANQSGFILKGDDLLRLGADVIPLFFGGNVDASAQAIIQSFEWVDFTTIGQIDSPQFFRRSNGPGGGYISTEDGSKNEPLPYYKQIFDLDPVTGAAFERNEKVTFWLTVPKGRQGKPAPVVILGHGYTSAKLEAIAYAGYFARMGLATLAIDCVSHGVDASERDVQLAAGIAQGKGLGDFFVALTTDRAFDLNGDGKKDSGADFWTSYVLHTRDVVKQSTIDHMQLVRVFKAFDGKKTWKHDVNRNKKTDDDIAGDFDGDGIVDVGGSASVHVTGGSLGGIMSVMLGGLEPYMETALPVSGGAGLAEIGIRSIQGGVKEAVNWRMMGPFLSTRRNTTTGKLDVLEQIPNLNGKSELKVATLEADPKEGDTVIIRNVTTGEYRCTRVHSDPDFGTGLIGAAVSSDEGNVLRLEIYDGPLPAKLPEGCSAEGATPKVVIDTLQYDVEYHAKKTEKGQPLVAFSDGFGLRRNSPESRRFMGIAQIALESGDPVNFAPFFEKWLLKYGTGEEVRTRAMVINTIGDMNVPMATGVSIARAAGFIDLSTKDPRYGKTPNRVLIDNHVLEAVERAGPYKNSQGQPVLMDVDHYSNVQTADDGFDVPRLSPPLRLQKRSERLGGYSGMMLPMPVPTGKHGFDAPKPDAMWNLGGFMFGAMGRYMSTDGREFNLDKCNIDFSCDYFPSMVPQ